MKTLFLTLIVCIHTNFVYAENMDTKSDETSDLKSSFTIEQYLRGIFQNDLSFKVSKQQLKISQSQYFSDKANFISEITGGVTKNEDKTDSNVSLLQNIGFGGAFDFSYSNLDASREYFVQYKQQLIKNAFGTEDRTRTRRSKHLLDAEKIMLDNFKAGLCQSASQKFMDTLVLQKTLEINKQTMEDAQVALNAVTNAYNRRLITRDAFLSAETDFLETKQSYVEMRANLELQKKTMALLSKNEVNGLSEPQPIDNFSTLEIKDQMEAYRLRIKASELEVKLLPSWKKPDLGLILKTGQNTFNQTNDNYMLVGMELSWPVYNRKNFELVNQSLFNYEISKLNLELRQQYLEEQKLVIDTNLKNLKTKIVTLNEVTKNSKEQLRLAFNKLKLGQIEFEDYLLVRNKLNRELMDLVSSEAQFFIENLNHLVINNKIPNYCAE